MKWIFTIIVALFITATAFADDPPTSIPEPQQEEPQITTPKELSNGFYVEPYVGYGYVNALENATRRTGFSGGLAFGYKIMDNWAMDVGYTQLPSANVSTYYFYLSLKYILTITPSWNIFAKLGPTYVRGSRDRAEGASDEIALLTGLGVTYWISQNVGFVIQGALTTRNDNVPLSVNATGGLDYFF